MKLKSCLLLIPALLGLCLLPLRGSAEATYGGFITDAISGDIRIAKVGATLELLSYSIHSSNPRSTWQATGRSLTSLANKVDGALNLISTSTEEIILTTPQGRTVGYTTTVITVPVSGVASIGLRIVDGNGALLYSTGSNPARLVGGSFTVSR